MSVSILRYLFLLIIFFSQLGLTTGPVRLLDQQVEEIRNKIKTLLMRDDYVCSVTKTTRISGEPEHKSGGILSAKDLIELGNDFAAPSEEWALDSIQIEGRAVVSSLQQISGKSDAADDASESAAFNEKTIQIYSFDSAVEKLMASERHFSSETKITEGAKVTTVLSTSAVVCHHKF